MLKQAILIATTSLPRVSVVHCSKRMTSNDSSSSVNFGFEQVKSEEKQGKGDLTVLKQEILKNTRI